MTLTVFDPRHGTPIVVKSLPVICDGFVEWNGEQRELADVHVTRRGVQVELLA